MAVAFSHVRGTEPGDTIRVCAAVGKEDGKRDKGNGDKRLHLVDLYDSGFLCEGLLIAQLFRDCYFCVRGLRA